MPDCAFFLAGACAAGDDCLYRHVNVGAAAAPCAAFRAAGWCEKGNACEFSHSGEGGLLWGGGINNNVAGERRGTAGGIAGATLRRKRKLTLRRATAGQEAGGGAAKEAAVPSFALQILGGFLLYVVCLIFLTGRLLRRLRQEQELLEAPGSQAS